MSWVYPPQDGSLAPLSTEASAEFKRLSQRRDSEMANGLARSTTIESRVWQDDRRSRSIGGTSSTILRGGSMAGGSVERGSRSSLTPSFRYGSNERNIEIGRISRSVSEQHLNPGAQPRSLGLGAANSAANGNGMLSPEHDEDRLPADYDEQAIFERLHRRSSSAGRDGDAYGGRPVNVETRQDAFNSLNQPHEHAQFSPVRFQERRSHSPRSRSKTIDHNMEFGASPRNPTPPRGVADMRSPQPKYPGGHQRSEAFAPTVFMRHSQEQAPRYMPMHSQSRQPSYRRQQEEEEYTEETTLPPQYQHYLDPRNRQEEFVPGHHRPRVGYIGSPHPFRGSQSRSNSRSIPMPELERYEGPYDAAVRRYNSLQRADAPNPNDESVLARQREGFDRVTSVKKFIPDNRSVLHEICTKLAYIRMVQPPPIPPDVYHAWDHYVGPGSFFVKYPRSGCPHERFFDLRMLESDAMTREPYLVWTTHEKAVGIKGQMHLTLLYGVREGCDQDDCFSKWVSDDRRFIKGPIHDAERSILPADFSLVVDFKTPKLYTIGLLALDINYFRAWASVLSFLGMINQAVPATADVTEHRNEDDRQSGRGGRASAPGTPASASIRPSGGPNGVAPSAFRNDVASDAGSQHGGDTQSTTGRPSN